MNVNFNRFVGQQAMQSYVMSTYALSRTGHIYSYDVDDYSGSRKRKCSRCETEQFGRRQSETLFEAIKKLG
jgi:hypothetical protein